MRKLKQTLTVLLAAAFAAGTWAGQAGAQNLDLNEMAAALVLPIISGGHAMQSPMMISRDDVVRNQGDGVTLATITNGKSSNVLLKVDLVDGDPGKSSWNSTSFECELTGRETTTFVFVGGAVYVECSKGYETDEDPQAFFTGFNNGFMFVAVADPYSGMVLSQNVIFGDAVVVDVTDGTAYGFAAIPFQAGQGQNDGDKVYRFDNQEYSKFPSVLATNFITPTPGNALDAELILFTLDGTTGSSPPPRAKLGGFAYNDDEEAIDFQYEFDCFDIIPLDRVNPNIINSGGIGLGTLSGHLELTAQPTATSNDAHDDQYGDGNDTRIRPIHGWIVQDLNLGGTLVQADQPIDGAPMIPLATAGGQVSWGRPLSQSTAPAVPFQWDYDATLDADVRN